MDLLRLRRLLRFVEDDLETFDESGLLARRREKLEKTEQLAGKPRSGNEVISIILEILIGASDNSRESSVGIRKILIPSEARRIK